MTKISQLTDIGSGLASGDEFVIRDVSDVGTPNKKLTANGFMNYVINQASGVGFTQIAAGVGPLSRVRATSSGSTGSVVFETALSGSLFERARIDSSGRLLVGTSSSIEVSGPGGQFQVADALAIASLSTFSNSTNSSFFMLGKSRGNTVGAYTIVNNQDLLGEIRFAGSNGTHLNNFAASIQGMVDGPPTASGLPGRLLFSTTASGSAISAERMRIDSSGRVGIGTSTPRGQLSISNNVAGAGVVDSTLHLGFSGADYYGFRIVNSNDPSITAAGTLKFQRGNVTNWIDALTIDNAGRLFIGTTTPLFVDNIAHFRKDLTGTEGIPFVISNEAGSTAQTYRSKMAAGANDTASFHFVGTSGTLGGGTDVIYIHGNGNVVNANNSYGALSDIKLKENIVDANSQWSDIKALQVRNYNLKEGQTHTQIGLVAQEAELVSPGLITESPDQDAEGNDLGTVTKSVNYSVLYMKAVKALQEAMERIETLETRLTAAGIA